MESHISYCVVEVDGVEKPAMLPDWQDLVDFSTWIGGQTTQRPTSMRMPFRPDMSLAPLSISLRGVSLRYPPIFSPVTNIVGRVECRLSEYDVGRDGRPRTFPDPVKYLDVAFYGTRLSLSTQRSGQVVSYACEQS